MYQQGCHWTDFRDIWYGETFTRISRQTPLLAEIWQKYRTLYENLSMFVLLTAVPNILQLNDSAMWTQCCIFFWHQWTLLYCWEQHVSQQAYRWKVLLCFHDNNGYAKAPKWYVSCTLSIFQILRDFRLGTVTARYEALVHFWSSLRYPCLLAINFSASSFETCQ